jgi:MFS family permease
MTLRLLVLFLLRGSVYGCVGPWAAVLLINAGLNAALVAPLAAAAAIVTLVAAPTWGRLGDRHGRRRMLVVAFLLGAPAALGHAAGVLTILIPAYLAWAIVSSAFAPLADSLALARFEGSRSRYARVRVGASTGYILASLVVGATITFTGVAWSAPGLIGAGLCVATASVVAVRLGNELRSGTGVAQEGGEGLLHAIRTGIGRYRWFLLGLALVYAGANAPSLFTGPRIAEIGGTGWDIGLATAAGTLVEVPAFLAVPVVLRLLGGRRMFLVAGFLLGASGLMTALAPTPALLIAARLLFGAGFAWAALPSLAAVLAAAPADGQAGASALHFATGAVGSLLVAAAGLPLVGMTGSVAAVLAVAALVTPIGAVACVRTWPAALPRPTA